MDTKRKVSHLPIIPIKTAELLSILRAIETASTILGFMASDTTTYKGRRADTYTSYLKPIESRKNLKISRFSYVYKVKLWETEKMCCFLPKPNEVLESDSLRLWHQECLRSFVRTTRHQQVCSSKEGNNCECWSYQHSPLAHAVRYRTKVTSEWNWDPV